MRSRTTGLFGRPHWQPTRGQIPGNARSAVEAATRAAGVPTNPHASFSSQLPVQSPETLSLAKVSTDAPRIPWDTFIDGHFSWSAGQHLAVIGPTGQGKTTLMYHLLPLHPYVVVMATKPRDKSMVSLAATGYHVMQRWQSLDPKYYPRRIVWPDASRLDSVALQKKVFTHALDTIYREGGWTVAIDELWYFIHELKLDKAVRLYLLQARSLGISLCVGTQRPAFVPLEVYDQSEHLFFFRDNDETNLRRMSGIAYRSAGLIRHLVSNLEDHQALYINTRSGFMCRTRSPEIPAIVGRG